ncbi:MAG: hypothetical protein KIT68_01645 [Phycisphaeraceae bacterium]|nr:hypothetical protein [Phycisphaeraceae bacterium]
MNDITRVLRMASGRLAVSRFIATLVFLLTAAIVTALALRVAEQALGLAVPWWSIAGWGGASVVAASVVWALVRRDSAQRVARRVDEGADLKEAISTALYVKADASPWSAAVVESAARAARGVDVRRAVPIVPPRQWPAPLVAALSLLVVWMVMPSLDLLGSKAQAAAKQADQKKVEQAKVEAKAAETKVQEMLAKLEPPPEQQEPKAGEATPPKANTPEEIRRAAVKSLTDMKERLERLKGSAKAMTGEALRDKMKQLKPPGPGPLAEVARSMAQADFDKAAEGLKELSQKLASGEMSTEQREELARQLEKMKEQLAKLADERKDLERRLEEAGLDRKLAADPEALKKAMEQNQNLSEEQKQQLAEMASAMQQAGQQCQNMAQAMGQMAKGMGKDGMNQEGMQGMEAMQGQLSQAEMMMQDMEGVEAALAEAKFQLQQMTQKMPGDSDCKGGMGECEGGLAGGSPWKGGEPKSGSGNGANQGSRDFGGGGQADGSTGTEAKDDESWQKRKARSPLGDGPTIGTTFVQGDQIKGESKAQFRQTTEAAAQQATEALESAAIPREYHDVIKHYFGRIKARGAGEAPGGAPAGPAGPAAPAKDAGKK